jgi:branched-chain amino acid transport system permease protein
MAAPAGCGENRAEPARLLKEAALTAGVALLLALPLGGLRTVGTTGGLGLEWRPLYVVVPVLAAFVGRLAVMLFWARRRRRQRASSESLMDRIARGVSTYAVYIAPVGFLGAVVLPFLPFSNRYLIDTATSVLIYIMLGWGLNIVVGLAGLLDLGYVAFYAVGAYSYALLATKFGWSFWTCLPLAGLLAAVAGIILGFPVLRLRGDYLAIVTLGFGEIIRLILLNWYKVTNGPDGISRIPRPSFFGLEFTRRPAEGVTAFHEFFGLSYSGEHRVIFLYYLILLLALMTNVFTQRLRRLPVSRAWEALREDEIACRSLGINPTNTKLTAFGLGALFGGFAGAFFATRQGFISPESFTFIESAIILAIVVLGGMGSQIGVVLAAIVLIVLPELGRALAQFRMLVFGGAMVAIMVWRPRGLLAHRQPTVVLHGKRGRVGGMA